MEDALAGALLARSIEKANEMGIRVCIAIVDDRALLKTFKRMDNAFKGSIDVAIGKTRTSALFPLASEDFGKLLRDERLTGMEATNGGLVAFVPVVSQYYATDVLWVPFNYGRNEVKNCFSCMAAFRH